MVQLLFERSAIWIVIVTCLLESSTSGIYSDITYQIPNYALQATRERQAVIHNFVTLGLTESYFIISLFCNIFI